MKGITNILILIFLTTILSYGQGDNVSSSGDKYYHLYDSIKGAVNSKWLRNNPKLLTTQRSYFKKDSNIKYYVGLLYISGNSIPFTWDDDLSLLNFLLAKDKKGTIAKEASPDLIYHVLKISWDQPVSGLIWFNETIYQANIRYWHFSQYNECPGTLSFPSLSFEKVADIPNAIMNNIEGLFIFPYLDDITKIYRKEVSLKTSGGNTISGKGYDVNGDGINDIFTYSEKIDESTWYTRLYINIEGTWECMWINLDEVCL